MDTIEYVNLGLHLFNSALICGTTIVEVAFMLFAIWFSYKLHKKINGAIKEIRKTVHDRATYQWLIDEIKSGVPQMIGDVKKNLMPKNGLLSQVANLAQGMAVGPSQAAKGSSPAGSPGGPPPHVLALQERQKNFIASLPPEKQKEFGAIQRDIIDASTKKVS